MKKLTKTLIVSALFGATAGAQAAPFLVPNGNFNTPDGADWTQDSADGATVISYEATGGNPGGFGKIDNSIGGAWAVLVSEGGTGANPATGVGIPLAQLGLTADETYTFSVDLIDLGAGGTTAGIKIESWSESGQISSSGDQLFPTTTSWATYSYDYKIAATATRIKVVPVISGSGSQGIVGFDNVGYNSTPANFVPLQIPNGDFEIPNGANWGTVETVPSYPTTGGNPGGHVVLNPAAGQYPVVFAFNDSGVTFASLGLAPGDTLTIQVDMRNVTGTNIGGIRMVGDAFGREVYPAVIGNGGDWATYTIETIVPAAPASVKIGLVAGEGTTVAFDNVSIIVPQEIPLCAEVAQGTMVNWSPTSTSNSYQPQSSTDGVTYTNLGPAIDGDSVNSVYDPNSAPFYQVLEATIDDSDDILNGGFEDVDEFDAFCAQSWTCVIGILNEQFPTRLATDNTIPGTIATADQVRTGVASLQLKVVNAETEAAAGKSLTQQNILNSGGSITPGNTYTFSFWAKQVSSGPSYVQGYKLAWLDETGGIVGTGAEGGFVGGSGTWAETSVPGLVAPANATSALIEIFGATGAVDGGFGEVLLDDITLITEGSTPVGTLPATASPGVGVTWPTEEGFSYQLKASSDLITFTDLGAPVVGDGSSITVGEPAEDHKFFQVVKSVLP